MEIVSSVSTALDAVNWSYIVPIVYGMAAFFTALCIKNYIVSLHALMSFRASIYISTGTWITIPTSTGTAQMEIISANRSVIVLENKHSRMLIPTKQFRDRDWTIIKREGLSNESIPT